MSAGTGAPLQVRRAGDRALLAIPPDAADVPALHAAAHDLTEGRAEGSAAGVQDVLPAAETVLLTLEPGADIAVVEQALRRAFDARSRDARTEQGDGPTVEIPVRYDGADLDDVAALLGITAAEVVALHTGTHWRCAFIGFAPGFGYLTSPMPDAPLVVPRRRESRTAVPPGAVALADGYSAVYPRRSPGGWQLIGTTDLPMWDLRRTPPNLLAPGTRVRFVEVSS